MRMLVRHNPPSPAVPPSHAALGKLWALGGTGLEGGAALAEAAHRNLTLARTVAGRLLLLPRALAYFATGQVIELQAANGRSRATASEGTAKDGGCSGGGGSSRVPAHNENDHDAQMFRDLFPEKENVQGNNNDNDTGNDNDNNDNNNNKAQLYTYYGFELGGGGGDDGGAAAAAARGRGRGRWRSRRRRRCRRAGTRSRSRRRQAVDQTSVS